MTGEAATAWTASVARTLPANLEPQMLVEASGPAWTTSSAGGVRRETVPVADHPLFDQAIRFAIPTAFEKPWGATAHSPSVPVALPAHRVVLASMWMRTAVTQGGESGNVRIYLERSPDWDGLGETGATLDGTWRLIHIVAVTKKNYAAGSVRVACHLGMSRQTIELGPVSVLDVGAADAVDLRALPTNAIRWAGMEPDAPWRAEAARRIDRYRRRDLALTIRDANGLPLAGAPIVITQLKRTVSFGSFTGYDLLLDDADGARLREKFGRLFDRVTVPVYWADWGWLSREAQYVALAEWAARHQPLDIRAHTLIYPGWRFMPAHMKAMAGDPPAFQAACLAQIRRVAERLKGVPFTEIDVANELRQLTEVVDVVGRDGVAAWFAEARRAFPGVKLCLNENTILTAGGATETEQANLLEWYHFLKSRGQAPDVLGFQGHFSEAVTGPERVWEILDRFAAETDAEFQITEFDLNTLNDQVHADYTRDFLTAVFAHPRVTGVTLWGFWEGDHWLPNAAVWRRDWTPRPAAAVYEELLGRKWRTHVEGATDAAGLVSTRVFTGNLLARVALAGGRTVDLPFEVAPGEGTAVVALHVP
jgi:endo-1,4-beta-xylanase